MSIVLQHKFYSMKKTKITYWIVTILFCLPMLLSATMYLTSPEVKANFAKIGFNNAFRVELAMAKYIGVLLLLIPFRFRPAKEWAYAGFGITLISATILHISNGDPVGNVLSPLVFLCVLVVSYVCFNKLRNAAGQAAK